MAVELYPNGIKNNDYYLQVLVGTTYSFQEVVEINVEILCKRVMGIKFNVKCLFLTQECY